MPSELVFQFMSDNGASQFRDEICSRPKGEPITFQCPIYTETIPDQSFVPNPEKPGEVAKQIPQSKEEFVNMVFAGLVAIVHERHVNNEVDKVILASMASANDAAQAAGKAKREEVMAATDMSVSVLLK